MARKGSKGSRREGSRTEWTFLEKAFGVLVLLLIAVAVYAFLRTEEVVEVESIETYDSVVDLRAGDTDASSYSFERRLKVDYQVRFQLEVVEEGPKVHFRVHNGSTGQVLVGETVLANYTSYEKLIRVRASDAGDYEFEWWVEGASGRSRVHIDVLIQPTERIFEKKS